ncbi:bifunctional hydroxymethylpyrimidine kinase/phosphomethylpyrimidine kinase [Aquabacterium sp.]|uniref:bifunctional hydroxymethylpyrimidine kinase/phosphomethylpyrimidine kinase n=1 Tax=Aquabacterium sp. TaxID=1872578 RepID=UPI003CFED311
MSATLHTHPDADQTLSPRERPPVIWSIAGQDSAGGAGLSADQRAADALGVHLCPVVSALTAQHSREVEAVFPVPAAQLESQLRALSGDLPPRAIKTGLLGSVTAIETVARWVDHWRAQTPAGSDPHRQLALIVDPVLDASAGGTPFSDEAIVAAYRTLLLPRATVITPNRAEARRLLGEPATHDGPAAALPALARALRTLGARSVVITGGDAPMRSDGRTSAHCLDWLDSPHAQGWLTAPRVPTPHTHGTGCTFASGVAAAWALGHVEADAIVLARMLTHHALARSHAAGQGAGPVMAHADFAAGAQAGGAPLPWLGLGEALPWQLTLGDADAPVPAPLFQPFAPPPDGLYGIVPDSVQLGHALQAGLRCVQLRHKNHIGLQAHLDRSVALCQAQSAQLFINDHWRAALQTLAHRFETESSGPNAAVGLHLGQEDLLALDASDRHTLLDARQRLMLGLSSHSLWELARAAGCGASLIACGPVQPTTTKDMPWVPQGTDNLSWWVRHSPAPVVAIGGLLTPDDVQGVGRCHPAAACVVRGLGQDLPNMQAQVPRLQQAWQTARRAAPVAPARLPHPCLPTHSGATPAHAAIHRTIPELVGRPSTLAMHTLSLPKASGLPADTPRAGLPASPA